jgi:hypothetical protein
MAYKNFVPNVLSSSEVQTYLMNQSVMVFANSTARSAALTAPTEGMVTYLQDTNILQIYDGSAWVGLKTTTLETTGNATVGGGLTVDSPDATWATFKVDHVNNRVGIGAASPANQLEIYNTVAGGSLEQITISGNNSAGAKTNYLRMGATIEQGAAGIESGGFSLRTLRSAVEQQIATFDGTAGVQKWRFYTEGVERLRIDTLGRVQTPGQPKFLVYSGGFNVAGNAWTDISTLGGAANRVVDYNVGGHWNSTTGLFTAPVDGYYLFFAGGWGAYNGAGNRYAISFHINAGVGGDWLYISGANTSAVDTPLAMSPVVRYMQSGWYMRTAMFNAVGQQLGTSSHKFYYGGYLLG